LIDFSTEETWTHSCNDDQIQDASDYTGCYTINDESRYKRIRSVKEFASTLSCYNPARTFGNLSC